MEFIAKMGYVRPTKTINNPITMSTSPSRRNELSGVAITFCTQYFIFSGAAKYGNPSMIMTMPNTHRKNFIPESQFSRRRHCDDDEAGHFRRVKSLTLF